MKAKQLILVLGLVLFFSCEKYTDYQSAIIGTWQQYAVDSTGTEVFDIPFPYVHDWWNAFYVFEDDSTGEYVYEIFGGYHDIANVVFSYIISKDTIVFLWDGWEEDVFRYSINDNVLILIQENGELTNYRKIYDDE